MIRGREIYEMGQIGTVDAIGLHRGISDG